MGQTTNIFPQKVVGLFYNKDSYIAELICKIMKVYLVKHAKNQSKVVVLFCSQLTQPIYVDIVLISTD